MEQLEEDFGADELSGPEKEREEVVTMKRTPQPTLTQSRLTGSGMLKIQNPIGSPTPGGSKDTARDRSFSEGDSFVSSETIRSPEKAMDKSTPEVGRKRPRSDAESDGMREFFLQALKMNKEEIITSLQSSIGDLARKVEANVGEIAANKADIIKQSARTDLNDSKLEKLTARVRALEMSGPRSEAVQKRAVLSTEYQRARRSVRMWPIAGSRDEDMWGNVGEFLHGPLGIPDGDIGQDDVEEVVRVIDGVRPENIKDEATVIFKDKRIRDMVMAASTNLATCVDANGKPTAGTRLELPDELKDTFRLLSRFGTRLRARHGEGTKRHVKFDDFAGSLYSIIKLPGDEKWTRVTPEMARHDLEASLREEDAANQKRMAAKMIPGPRERLRRAPMEASAQLPITAIPTRALARSEPPITQCGKRPRWAAPPRRPV